MATCKECLHIDVCGGFISSDLDRDVFDYCREGRTDEIPDIEKRCNNFNDKSRYVEVKRGEWSQVETTHRGQKFRCSVCKGVAYYPQPTRDKKWSKHCGYDFCPNCGAVMRGSNND